LISGSRPVKYGLFYAVFLSALLIDQYAKHLTVSSMRLGQSIPLAGSIFRLTYITNTGAAFGILKGANAYFIILSALLMIFLYIYLATRKSVPLLTQAALGLISGGATGNLLDRIFRGHVVDFFDVRFFSVFNTADLMINLGVAILLFEMVVLKSADKRD
jgi:signal peptidase II